MAYWLLNLLFAVKTAFCSCQPEARRLGVRTGKADYQVVKVGRLPAVINESSGLTRRPGRPTLLTHNDSGGRPTLYDIDRRGTLLDSLPLPVPNVDWEAVTSDDSAVVFVADIGNNLNNRQNLAVYRVRLEAPAAVDTIRFRYADQTAFPPPAAGRNYDSEAVFYRADTLHLFSKNRSGRQVRYYQLPAQPGDYVLTPRDSVFVSGMVTDAAISPDGRTFALLTYGKLLLFAVPTSGMTVTQPIRCLRVPRGQTEAIAFISNTDLMMTNEKGKLFLIRKKP